MKLVIDGERNLSEGPLTVFAPLLEDNSVTVGLEDGAQINDANVTMTNVRAKNGVIHVIDAVLLPK